MLRLFGIQKHRKLFVTFHLPCRSDRWRLGLHGAGSMEQGEEVQTCPAIDGFQIRTAWGGARKIRAETGLHGAWSMGKNSRRVREMTDSRFQIPNVSSL